MPHQPASTSSLLESPLPAAIQYSLIASRRGIGSAIRPTIRRITSASAPGVSAGSLATASEGMLSWILETHERKTAPEQPREGWGDLGSIPLPPLPSPFVIYLPSKSEMIPSRCALTAGSDIAPLSRSPCALGMPPSPPPRSSAKGRSADGEQGALGRPP